MAKFRYRMQNILEIKEKMEEQEKSGLRYRQCKAFWRNRKLQKLLSAKPVMKPD